MTPVERALGGAWLYPDRIIEIAQAAGMEPSALEDELNTDEGAKRGAMLAAELERGGELVREKALGVLETLIEVIRRGAEAGDMSVATATKAADTIFKITGIADERARVRASLEPEKPQFSITLNLSGSSADADAITHRPKAVARIEDAAARVEEAEVTEVADDSELEGSVIPFQWPSFRGRRE
jgi:hypothetical protein